MWIIWERSRTTRDIARNPQLLQRQHLRGHVPVADRQGHTLERVRLRAHGREIALPHGVAKRRKPRLEVCAIARVNLGQQRLVIAELLHQPVSNLLFHGCLLSCESKSFRALPPAFATRLSRQMKSGLPIT